MSDRKCNVIAIPRLRRSNTGDLYHLQILTPTEAFQCLRRHFLHLRNCQAPVRPGFGRRTVRPWGETPHGFDAYGKTPFPSPDSILSDLCGAVSIAPAAAKGFSGAPQNRRRRPERMKRRQAHRLANRLRQKSSPAWPTFSLRLLRSPPIRTHPAGSYATFASVRTARCPARTSSCGLPLQHGVIQRTDDD